MFVQQRALPRLQITWNVNAPQPKATRLIRQRHGEGVAGGRGVAGGAACRVAVTRARWKVAEGAHQF